MFSLKSQSGLGRRLTDVCHLAVVLAGPRASAGRWSQIFDNFVQSDRLSKVQNESLEVESNCLRWWNVRLQGQQQLIATQTRLKDLHSLLRNVSTADKSYPGLLADELQLLKSIRALSYDFHLHEEAEKEKFLLFERALVESQTEEWKKANLSHRFFVYACLVGLVFGITGTLTSIFLHGYLTEDPEQKSNRLLRHLAAQLVSIIDARNKVIETILQDISLFLDSTSAALPYDRNLIQSYLNDVDNNSAISQFQEALDIFNKRNDENNKDMKRLLSLLQNRQLSCGPHTYTVPLPVKEKEVDTAPDISLLWRTTFMYSLLVVAVPLAYSLLT